MKITQATRFREEGERKLAALPEHEREAASEALYTEFLRRFTPEAPDAIDLDEVDLGATPGTYTERVKLDVSPVGSPDLTHYVQRDEDGWDAVTTHIVADPEIHAVSTDKVSIGDFVRAEFLEKEGWQQPAWSQRGYMDRNSKAIFEADQSWKRRSPVLQVCQRCGRSFQGRAGTKYHSDNCRKRAHEGK
jgi:uncharacterized OB-fold protein